MSIALNFLPLELITVATVILGFTMTCLGVVNSVVNITNSTAQTCFLLLLLLNT